MLPLQKKNQISTPNTPRQANRRSDLAAMGGERERAVGERSEGRKVRH
jgi:hypothetical protein